jgi:putative nucleotidyltransferase with HDIG domain
MTTTPTLSLDELRNRLSETLFTGKLELPVLPATASKVLELCRSSDCDAAELVNVIQRDQSMSGRLLRIANSAAYGAAEEIVSLRQAVGRLGFGVVSEIAISVALKAKAFAVPGHEERLRAMWIHSATAAAWASEIARQHRANVEGAFMCGLLHDCGKPIVFMEMLNLIGDAGVHTQGAHLSELIDEFHQEAGGRLIEGWGLPQWMADAARHHHAPEGAADSVELARITCLADLCAHWSTKPTEHNEQAIEQSPVLKALGIYADELEALFGVRDRVRDVSQAFA